MTHQQMTLYLLERINNNSDENQEGCASEELRECLLNIKQAGKRRHNSDESNEQ